MSQLTMQEGYYPTTVAYLLKLFCEDIRHMKDELIDKKIYIYHQHATLVSDPEIKILYATKALSLIMILAKRNHPQIESYNKIKAQLHEIIYNSIKDEDVSE